jgi:3-deoxy-7-phosphoheptulonate synthase
MAVRNWTPSSWHEAKLSQHATYPDPQAVTAVVERLSRMPPIVTSWEIEKLRSELAAAANGETFVLQGGDCAEMFDECTPEKIVASLKVLMQMSLVLSHGLKRRVVRIGRIAGQYAKPRSSDQETKNGVTLPAYRGEFTPASRTPDPQRLLAGYQYACSTLNFARALTQGGFADLRRPRTWELGFLEGSQRAEAYRAIVDRVADALQFLESVGGRMADLDRVDLYTAHEGLSLDYEQAMTRQVPRRTGYYDLSTHFPWIGMRTAALDGAHVEFFRGIRNPMGVKIGPSAAPEAVVALAEALDPERLPGRLTLITRLGAGKVRQHLPPLVDAIRRAGRRVLWIVDPMHGNTESTADGTKTRDLVKIEDELLESMRVHEEMDSILGGIHVELTGENVTECVGGARGLVASDLGRNYRSRVDPRLNGEQALELAMLVADRMHGRRRA